MIEVRGKARKMCRAEIKFATAFFAQYLMGESLTRKLDIEVVLEDQGMAEGHCSPLEAEKRPKSFEIGINPKMARHKMLLCLAHEMVHVKQYAKNELQTDSHLALFKGRPVLLRNDLESYLNYPWEIEAFGRERGLYLMYQLMVRQEKISFKNGRLYVRGKRMKGLLTMKEA